MKYRIPVIFVWGLGLAAGIATPQTRQGGFEGPGRYAISSTGSHLSVDLDRLDHHTVIQSPAREHDSQRWDIELAAPDLYYVRSAEDGKALEATGGVSIARCSAFERGISQQWRFEVAKEGGMLILSSDGRALEVNEGALSGARLRFAAKTGGANQRFAFRRVNKPPKEY